MNLITRSKLLAVVTLLSLAAKAYPIITGGVTGSAHDFSPGKDGSKACQYCHTPHRAMANTPLWNHKLSNAVYTIYSSSSLDAKVGQPTGSSKLCLSCHDGTIALESTLRNAGGGRTLMPPGKARLGTDLSDDHPISFVYSRDLSGKDPQLKNPDTLPEEIKLDKFGELQCSTCHDPHDNTFGKFLVTTNINSNLCLKCHDLNNWTGNVHGTSAVKVQNANDDYLKSTGYDTVAENGCVSCHRPHSAGGAERLLHFASEENNCLNCHNGQVAKNMVNDFEKLSGHFSSEYQGIHDIRESAISMQTHVECEDCHNPHAIIRKTAEAPFVSGALNAVSGVSAEGIEIDNAIYQYEVCYKCHTTNSPYQSPDIPRQITQTNTRLEFDQANPSYHPVTFQGVNRNVPSLISGLDESSRIYCTDCHSSDSTSEGKGPHGSIYPYLMAYRYETDDGTEETPSTYELCYKCHDRQSILGNESFSEHKKHIVDEKAPCSVCHDPHGISFSQGNAVNNSNLINFDISVVSEDPITKKLQFEDLGTFKGQCFLKCHDETHSPETYEFDPSE